MCVTSLEYIPLDGCWFSVFPLIFVFIAFHFVNFVIQDMFPNNNNSNSNKNNNKNNNL